MAATMVSSSSAELLRRLAGEVAALHTDLAEVQSGLHLAMAEIDEMLTIARTLAAAMPSGSGSEEGHA